MIVKYGDAKQGKRKEQELDGDAYDGRIRPGNHANVDVSKGAGGDRKKRRHEISDASAAGLKGANDSVFLTITTGARA
jgi:hypothetical protein